MFQYALMSCPTSLVNSADAIYRAACAGVTVCVDAMFCYCCIFMVQETLERDTNSLSLKYGLFFGLFERVYIHTCSELK